MGLDIVPPEVRTRVARVLLERNTRGINFTIGKVAISGYDYETIAILVSLGQVRVAFGELADKQKAAFYQGSEVGGTTNVLYLPRSYRAANLGLDSRSVIVHEATHAILDYKKRALRRLDSEMLAYFAQFWYGMANNFIYTLTNVDLGTEAAVIGYGTDCVRQYQSNGGTIQKELLENFRKAIKAMPLYGDADQKWSPGDGIPGLSGLGDRFLRGGGYLTTIPDGRSDPD